MENFITSSFIGMNWIFKPRIFGAPKVRKLLVLAVITPDIRMIQLLVGRTKGVTYWPSMGNVEANHYGIITITNQIRTYRLPSRFTVKWQASNLPSPKYFQYWDQKRVILICTTPYTRIDSNTLQKLLLARLPVILELHGNNSSGSWRCNSKDQSKMNEKRS